MRDYKWPEINILLFTILKWMFVLDDRPVNPQTLILKAHSKKYKTMNTAIMKALAGSIY
jgi:hypothetical protein